MRTQTIKHPLVTHRLTLLRDRDTPSPIFRQLVDEPVTLLAYEVMCDVAVCKINAVTPATPMKGLSLAYPRLVLVPILRVGPGMLEGMSRLLPIAEIGFLGVKYDEITLRVHTYVNRLLDDLSGHQCYAMDPVLATSHTLIDAVNCLLERGAHDVTCMCLLAAPEGLRNLEEAIGDQADVTIVSAVLDERPNENGYIVPGLGDAGDQLYGIVD